MIIKTENEIVNLLQGEWIDINKDIYFKISRDNIQNINGFENVNETKYEIKFHQPKNLWKITVGKFGWFSANLIIDEDKMDIISSGLLLFPPEMNKQDIDEKYKKHIKYSFKKIIVKS